MPRQPLLKKLRALPGGSTAARWLRRFETAGSDAVDSSLARLGFSPRLMRSPRGALEQWITAALRAPAATRGRIAVVAFRNRTWVEWALFAACKIRTMGYDPVMIFSRSELEAIYGRSPPGGPSIALWERAVGSGVFAAADLDPSGVPPSAGEDFSAVAERGAHMVAAYDLGVEELEPGDAADAYAAAVNEARRMIAERCATLLQVLPGLRVDRAICPSGFISWSIGFHAVAARLGLPTVFVEGWAMNPGHMVWNEGAPALEFDLENWLAAIAPWNAEMEADVEALIALKSRKPVRRGWLKDFHPVQRSAVDAPIPPAVEEFLRRPGPKLLLGTNVVGDSGTLGRAGIFRSQHEWLREVVARFRAEPSWNLIVRAHPDEVLIDCVQRMGEAARAAAGAAPNVLVIDGKDNINTYALADRCEVGLAWVSSLGVDMVLRGKPVLLAGRAQYGRLGIGISPKTRVEYHELLGRLAQHPTPPEPAMRQRAMQYLYIVFRRMSLRATGTHYNSAEYRVLPAGMHPDQETFYRILTGELDSKGRASA